MYVLRVFHPKASKTNEFDFRFSYSQDMVGNGYLNQHLSVQILPIETSAHTLCFAVLLLAAHPDKQRKVFQEVNNLWPSGAPTSDSFTVRIQPLLFCLARLMLGYLGIGVDV